MLAFFRASWCIFFMGRLTFPLLIVCFSMATESSRIAMGSRAIPPWHSWFNSDRRPDECNGRFSCPCLVTLFLYIFLKKRRKMFYLLNEKNAGFSSKSIDVFKFGLDFKLKMEVTFWFVCVENDRRFAITVFKMKKASILYWLYRSLRPLLGLNQWHTD